MQTISILGCGWLGIPLAEQLLVNGCRVKGSTTTVGKLKLLQEKGINAHLIRLQPQPIDDIEALSQADTFVIDIPPKAGKLGDDFHPQQISFLVDLLAKSSVKHVIYVSSTSVYPEAEPLHSATVVTEQYPLTPELSPAPGLIQAEQLVQKLGSVTEKEGRIITIARCAGLMGYDRIPGKYVAGRTVNSGAIPVNYIHRDDAVGLLSALIQQPLDGIFNVVAPEHPTRESIYRRSCADFGYELPIFVQPDTPLPYKIVSGEKLTKATNYMFKYPDPLQFFYT